MRLPELIGNLYQSFIAEDWALAEDLFDRYFRIIDEKYIIKYCESDYSVSIKYESLLLYNYSLACFHLNKYH